MKRSALIRSSVMAPSASSGHLGTLQYLITLTLFEHIGAFKRVNLKVPSREFIGRIEGETVDKIRQGFAGASVDVHAIPFSDHCDAIVATMLDIRREHPDAVVISTTPLISHDTNGACLHLTRLIDTQGELIAIGARSGQGTVETQLDQMESRISGKKVIVVEDGAFTGKTLTYLIDLLKKRNADVIAVVMGILFPEAERKLKKVFSGKLIRSGKEFSNPLDWMPIHDFFPCIPNAGRVIGTKLGNSAIPLYLPNGITLAIPYIFPYGDPVAWANLNFGRSKVYQFSLHCILKSVEIFQEMQRLNGREILVSDLMQTIPGTSLPASLNQTRYNGYDREERIVNILNADLEFLHGL